MLIKKGRLCGHPLIFCSVKLKTSYSLLVLGNTGIQTLLSGGIAGYIVRGVDKEFFTAIRKNLGNGADGHPYGSDESHRGYGTYLVPVIFEVNGCINEGTAGIYYVISYLKEVFTA
jgi:hypothetical protein